MKARFEQIMARIPLISNRTKLIISSLILAFAFAISCIRQNNIDSTICFFAMLFSFGGDIALNSMPLKNRPSSFLYAGAGLFMFAHLAYASAYFTLIQNSEKAFFNLGAILACIFMLTLFTVSVICTSRANTSPSSTTLLIFSIYTLVIGINFVTICSYSFSFVSASFIGALSFLISDFIIGVETVFKIKNDILRKLVWIFYPIGQILIIACR